MGLRVGDLVQLTGDDWASGWRDLICIVTSTYAPMRDHHGHTHKRWKVLAETGDALVVVREDVTILQSLNRQ